jgi:hypothetical protein
MADNDGRVQILIFSSGITISSKREIKSCDQRLKESAISTNILVLIESLKHLSGEENVKHHNEQKLHYIPKHGEQSNKHL